MLPRFHFIASVLPVCSQNAPLSPILLRFSLFLHSFTFIFSSFLLLMMFVAFKNCSLAPSLLPISLTPFSLPRDKCELQNRVLFSHPFFPLFQNSLQSKSLVPFHHLLLLLLLSRLLMLILPRFFLKLMNRVILDFF